MRALGLLVVLVLAQWMVKPVDPTRTAAPAIHSTGVALLVSSVRPLFERWMWFRFESHVNAGALPAALQDLRVLSALESTDVRPMLHLARFLAFDLAPREGTAPERIRRVFEAEAILADAARRFPSNPEVHLRHGQILSMPWAVVPELHTVYTNRRGKTPAAAAAEAFAAGLERAPGSSVLAVLAGDALRLACIERLLGGERDGWAGLERARVLIASVGDQAGPAQQWLSAAWSEAGRAMCNGDQAAAAMALARLPLGELPLEEQRLVRAGTTEILAACRPNDAEGARRCLPAALAVHRIHSAVAASAVGDQGSDVLRQLAVKIVRLAPELLSSVPRELLEER